MNMLNGLGFMSRNWWKLQAWASTGQKRKQAHTCSTENDTCQIQICDFKPYVNNAVSQKKITTNKNKRPLNPLKPVRFHVLLLYCIWWNNEIYHTEIWGLPINQILCPIFVKWWRVRPWLHKYIPIFGWLWGPTNDKYVFPLYLRSI